MTESAFRVEIPQGELDELRRRLETTRWPGQLEGVGWSYGVELGRLRELAEYWRTAYDWRRFEQRINQLPQFLDEIDGQRVHYLHLANPGRPVVMLLHGWPGSGADYLEVVELLRNDFALVVPTLPGFGLSGPTSAAGWGSERIARALVTLLDRLGYTEFGVHGYDWGSIVAAELGRTVPQRLTGLHLEGYLSFPGDEELTEAEQERLKGLEVWQTERSGYATIQGTRPQTLAYALDDSPVGQLAWFLEWYDDYGDRVGAISNDLILDSVALSWFTGTAGSAGRIYREATLSWDDEHTYVPLRTGLVALPGDSTVRRLVQREFDVVHFTEFDRGGHFAALEVPDLVAADLQLFFKH
ncbi:epoxide hydrolase [Kribbella sandramycini]|uniref:Epoxide hydrolase n=1 Tax=Kribbella sandramycini TaxID=60450 RepID=A0A7Y4NY47_9ACTN|nr:epoxide hydrolase family protein [Kribbella sandramycini]MBB6570030.1 pimeloyl-ACP methyl ester carboxylesterase [Kribbella sandramycini]NOL40146.1 epoxide hydrolase [Kribbella sandramycini]